MSARLDKVKLVKGEKWERQDPLDNLGVRTVDLVKDAIKEGKKELAKDLVDYYYFWETKLVLDANVDLVGGLPSYWMENYGEDTVYEVYRRMLGGNRPRTAPTERRDARPALDTPFDHAMNHALLMVRPHRMGKLDGTGGFVVEEYEDRWEVQWDPCYTGGRMRRGDQVSGTPPYTEAPYNYYVTKLPHTWTFGKFGLTGYCIHCYLMHALSSIESTGYLSQWVVAYPEDPWKPCPYIAYKELDWIPEEYYNKLGKTKPPVAKPIPKFKDVTKPIKVTHSHDLGPFWRVTDGEIWIHAVPRLKTAIDEGNNEKALRLIDALWAETASHHASYPITWNWRWIDLIVEQSGYSELYHALRSVYSPVQPPLAAGLPKPTKATLPSAEERVQKAATWGRGDLSGPNQEGTVRIIDEPDRIVMELNPCGSGGRGLMTIDKVDPIKQAVIEVAYGGGAGGVRGPYTGPPSNLGVTTVAHPVGWGKVGIPHICTRCCVHFEIDSLVRDGYLTTIIERPENATDPNCRWFFYKNLDDIPEKFYTRIGYKKPARQS